MTVLVQTEMAERITAAPGGKEWGGLSAKLALRYERSRGRSVGPQIFWPRPRVESRVVRLSRRAEPLDPEVGAAYDGLVSGLFQGRRKTLRKALIQAGFERERVDRVLEGYPGWRERRPEELGPPELLSLAASLGSAGRDIP
jgi:16S rRNA (adenine1518-N6/adenine1519-N6)-dimethyltransferase